MSNYLRRADATLYSVERVCALLSGFAVFALVILAVISVGGRNLFNSPVAGYVDWLEQAMPLIAFLGISYTQRNDGHIRMDMLVGRLRGRWLWLAELVATLAMLVVMLLLVWGSFSHFLRSFDISAPLWSRDSSIDIALPLWPAKLLAPLAFSVLCLRLFLQLLGFSRAFYFADAEALCSEPSKNVSSKAISEIEGFH